MDLDKERPIGVWLYLDHVLGIPIRHRPTDVVRGQEDFPKAALACRHHTKSGRTTGEESQRVES